MTGSEKRRCFPIKKLKELREKHHMTQEELAQKVGVSLSAIGMYEIGAREPRIKNAKKIASFFDVSIDFIMYGEIQNNDEAEKVLRKKA